MGTGRSEGRNESLGIKQQVGQGGWDGSPLAPSPPRVPCASPAERPGPSGLLACHSLPLRSSSTNLLRVELAGVGAQSPCKGNAGQRTRQALCSTSGKCLLLAGLASPHSVPSDPHGGPWETGLPAKMSPAWNLAGAVRVSCGTPALSPGPGGALDTHTLQVKFPPAGRAPGHRHSLA